MSSQLRTLARSKRRSDGTPEKNALAPKNTRGKPKGPARSPTQQERFALARMAKRLREAKATP
jgi:hypothetical protein